MLLSRVADRIYWAARYIERAEDTARIVRAHTEMLADLPQCSADVDVAAAHRDRRQRREYDARLRRRDVGERRRRRSCSSDHENPGSVVSCVGAARENLRTTRETVPRDGWQALNDLYLYVDVEVDRGVDRRARERFLGRVIADSRRIDGILATTMNHDEAYAMWRLGRAIERADMTTRVLGVRAAAVLSAAGDGRRRRAALRRAAVDGRAALAVRAADVPARGPRADRGAGGRALPARARPLPPGRAGAAARDPPGARTSCPIPAACSTRSTTSTRCCATRPRDGIDGAELDDAMDALQIAIAQLDRRIHERYLRRRGVTPDAAADG